LELNPQFAPAYSALARLYARTAGKLPEALSLAQVAAGLEPGRFAYQQNVGAILLQLNRVDEALTFAQRALAVASEPGERAQADAFLSNVQRYLEAQAEARRRQGEAEEARASRKVADDAASSSPHSPAREKGAEPGEQRSASKPAGRAALATGKITGVSCKAFELTLTLKMQGYSLDLHARNYMNIEFYSTNWQAPDNFNPCKHLDGLPAQIKYTPVKGASYGGEIITIDVRE
jgi:tetratricopeptide (TPR) repeat protein